MGRNCVMQQNVQKKKKNQSEVREKGQVFNTIVCKDSKNTHKNMLETGVSSPKMNSVEIVINRKNESCMLSSSETTKDQVILREQQIDSLDTQLFDKMAGKIAEKVKLFEKLSAVTKSEHEMFWSRALSPKNRTRHTDTLIVKPLEASNEQINRNFAVGHSINTLIQPITSESISTQKDELSILEKENINNYLNVDQIEQNKSPHDVVTLSKKTKNDIMPDHESADQAHSHMRATEWKSSSLDPLLIEQQENKNVQSVSSGIDDSKKSKNKDHLQLTKFSAMSLIDTNSMPQSFQCPLDVQKYSTQVLSVPHFQQRQNSAKDMKSLKIEKQQLTSKVELLQKQLEEKNLALEIMESSVIKMQAHIDEISRKTVNTDNYTLGKLRDSLSQTLNANELLRTRLQQEQANILTLKEESRNSAQAHAAVVDRFETELQRIKKELAYAENIVKLRDVSELEAENTISQLNKQLQKISSQVQEKDAELGTVRAELTQLSEGIKQRNTVMHELMSQAKEYKRQRNAERQRRHTLVEKIRSLYPAALDGYESSGSTFSNMSMMSMRSVASRLDKSAFRQPQ